MKICIDIQSVINKPAGVGRYTKELVNALSKEKEQEDITLCYFNFLGRYSGYNVLPNKAVKYIPGRIYNKLWKMFGFPPFNWIIGEYDIYHFPNFVVPPLTAGKAVITVHDLAFIRYPQYIEPKNLKFLERYLPESLINADKIIAVSRFTRDELIAVYKIPEERIEVIYEGVNPRFRPLEKKSFFPYKYILFTGTLEPRKNIEGLIRAFYLCGLDGYKLVIIGNKGWMYDGIFKLIDDLEMDKDVIFLNYVSDEELLVMYNNAELFVFPSFYEGFGLPPLEAMACGVPVVASKVNEVLGDSAFYIDPNDPESIADGIKTILTKNDLRQTYIKKGLEHAKGFTWDKAAGETLGLYHMIEK